MKFDFTKRGLEPGERNLQRLLEILPGLTSWSILAGMIFLSIGHPVAAVVMIIAFDFYWLLKLIYMTLFLILSYLRLMMERKTNWMTRVEGIDELNSTLEGLPDQSLDLSISRRLSHSIHLGELHDLKRSGNLPPRSRDIFHVVIFPVVKESREIIEPGIQSLKDQTFPSKRILVVLAVEDRCEQEIKDGLGTLQKKYQKAFEDLLVVVHPDHLPGESRVKGANVTYAAKRVTQYLKEKNIQQENVIVSCFDADTVVDLQYFSCLTYCFMVTPSRLQASFQPIPVYHNNIWQVPGFARVIETGSSFFQLVEATNPQKLVTFSSHSMSFKALAEVGYWPVDMISDDSAIFWKCYIHYDGHYGVVPLYITLSMDIASADTWGQTIQSVYKQKRRWAWGVENFPIVVRAFLRSRHIPIFQKICHTFKLFEGHVSWASWGFLLTFIGWLPIFFIREDSVMYYNVPRITQTIFNLALFSLLISITLSIGLLPKRNIKYPLLKTIGHALEWLLIPLILVFLSSLPALDAQTRMMLGKYMEFWVTDKKRGKKSVESIQR